MEPVIEIHGLTKDYETGFLRKKKVRALDDLTLSVKAGSIFGFLGANGAGKTTTIKVLMKLLFPTSGAAKILGRDIADVEMHREIGYCPENPYFYDYLTPMELLDYFGRLFGQPVAKRRERSAELLTQVGLQESDWNRHLRKFSKGMLQRVGLAQSLINEPQVVFLDEPMSGLDPIGRREVRELVAGLRDNGTTVLMSTHILSDVETLCDEVAILRRGRLAAAGKLDELLLTSTMKDAYEIAFRGIEESAVISAVSEEAISIKPGGITITVSDETEIEKVLLAGRKGGGRLVSVLPIRRTLEDLFVSETIEKPKG